MPKFRFSGSVHYWPSLYEAKSLSIQIIWPSDRPGEKGLCMYSLTYNLCISSVPRSKGHWVNQEWGSCPEPSRTSWQSADVPRWSWAVRDHRLTWEHRLGLFSSLFPHLLEHERLHSRCNNCSKMHTKKTIFITRWKMPVKEREKFSFYHYLER